MISVAEADQDALRFLWINDINQEFPEIVVMWFARVTFGVSSSLFLLNATIQYHLNQFCGTHLEFVQMLLRSIYVDGISFGAESDDSL